ncbi:uncharacterized protein LOC34617323 [Cyclospora cayetanensis]|uniref:Uncharacterized protein LOC34617323 n=1 Tax=Cyclospora cayetanensis TaxID=88456 RepID=A0A6P6RRU6_9EIME|nr:uncharacterized protein LOC34617323 [Cyclospora cayetanensis]
MSSRDDQIPTLSRENRWANEEDVGLSPKDQSPPHSPPGYPAISSFQEGVSTHLERGATRPPHARRARPGAHFQAPPTSPRAPLVHCNTLFKTSTVQAPLLLEEDRGQEAAKGAGDAVAVPRTKSTPVSADRRGITPPSSACEAAGVQLTQAPSSPQPQASTTFSAPSDRESQCATSSPKKDNPSQTPLSSQFASAQHSGSRPPGRLGIPNAQGGLSFSSEKLLSAAPYFKAFQEMEKALASTTPKKHIPMGPRHISVAMQGAPPVKVFCGTWNCQYQEFPVNFLTNQKTAVCVQRISGSQKFAGGSETPSPLSGEVSPSSVIAECLPEEVPADVIAKLDGDFETLFSSDGNEAEGQAEGDGQPQEPAAAVAQSPSVRFSPPLTRRGTIRRGDLLRSSTRQLTAVQGEDQPLGEWLLPGYDVYVVSLQETLGQTIFNTVTVYLTAVNGVSYKRIKFSEDKLSGLGDGAWMQFKSTSLAVWAREDLEGEGMPVSLVSSKAASVSFLSGSKGGVSVCLKIWNQFFCFIGCHMPSTSPEDRRKARAVVEQRLLEFYGGASSWNEAFHHVIWMGDFNFRTQRMTAQRAVTLLKQSLRGLLNFDEWMGQSGEDMRASGFTEAPICFPPTYKKADGRPPVNMGEPKWVEQEYQTQMVTQWYKGSRLQDRVPSVCADFSTKVFKCSLPEMSSLVRFQPNVYFSALPKRPSFLIASDHSPVGLGLDCYPLDMSYIMPEVTSRTLAAK